LAALETGFFNLSVARVYTLCSRTFTSEFGELQVAIGRDGSLRAGTQQIEARYAVVPARLGIGGRVIARNPDGRQVLVAPSDGRLTTSDPDVGCTPTS
jgi:hypothetical protein